MLCFFTIVVSVGLNYCNRLRYHFLVSKLALACFFAFCLIAYSTINNNKALPYSMMMTTTMMLMMTTITAVTAATTFDEDAYICSCHIG